jgi:hypothetical protein
MAGGGKAGEVGHLTPARQAHTRPRRQAEEIQEPLADGLLRDRRRGADGEAAPVLVPHRCQPVGGDRRIETATDDKPEVSGTLRPDEAGIRRRDQLLDHLQRRSRRVVEIDTQRGAQLVERRVRADRPLRERRQVLRGDLSGAAKKRGVHRPTLLRRGGGPRHGRSHERPRSGDRRADAAPIRTRCRSTAMSPRAAATCSGEQAQRAGRHSMAPCGAKPQPQPPRRDPCEARDLGAARRCRNDVGSRLCRSQIPVCLTYVR